MGMANTRPRTGNLPPPPNHGLNPKKLKKTGTVPIYSL